MGYLDFWERKRWLACYQRLVYWTVKLNFSYYKQEGLILYKQKQRVRVIVHKFYCSEKLKFDVQREKKKKKKEYQEVKRKNSYALSAVDLCL